MVATLLLALVLTGGPGTPAAADAPVLSVPYLPQTEALCGGAAAAMVFRYWGDRHADAQQFVPLVDWRAGGISTDALVGAVRARSWQANAFRGSIEQLRAALGAAQPLILLIEDRPDRYHYVVAVGADDRFFYVHDPTWGPARQYTESELLTVWRPTGLWALHVHPEEGSLPRAAAPGTAVVPRAASACDLRLADALSLTPSAAAAVLSTLRLECPTDSRPVSELAGIRFSERRYGDAATLAEEAVLLDPSDGYGWDVLGSSRFVLDDRVRALEAWNHIDKPRIDRVQLDGLTNTSYALVAEVLDLAPNTLLTGGALRRAERRLRELPTAAGTRVGYRPDQDDFALVDAALVERRARPEGAAEWAAVGARALFEREIRVGVPGGTGQGEVWSASGRWWRHRPRVAGRFTAPRVGRLRGVWHADLAWETETYAVPVGVEVEHERLRGAVGLADWLTADLRYEASVAADLWDGRRTGALGGALDQRLLDDRLSLGLAAEAWVGRDVFASAALRARYRSATRREGWLWGAEATFERATRRAPLGVWPGAGDGHARRPLLRAHALLVDGIVAGPVFGRQLAHASLEATRWTRPIPSAAQENSLGVVGRLPIGLALFVDAARAAHRMSTATGAPFHVDAGVGLRLGLVGSAGVLRVDVARGLGDRIHALTVGLVRDW